MHYNTTGMIALSLCMMSLPACNCAKKPLLKAVCVVPAATTAAVIVLTQSRTSRYALLIALAFGTFDLLWRALAALAGECATAAALVSAVIVLAGSYEVCKLATEAALEHYTARRRNVRYRNRQRRNRRKMNPIRRCLSERLFRLRRTGSH